MPLKEQTYRQHMITLLKITLVGPEHPYMGLPSVYGLVFLIYAFVSCCGNIPQELSYIIPLCAEMTLFRFFNDECKKL